MHLLFLTTVNLSSNPRLVKEIKLAVSIGYKATVVAFQLGNWSDENDARLLVGSENVVIHYISANRSPFFPWLTSSLVEQICIGVSSFNKKNIILNAFAHNKRTLLLYMFLRQLEGNFDFIIAHNLGALFPAYYYSVQFGVSFGFDVEDFHPGELIKGKNVLIEVKRRKLLMRDLLPKAGYVTYASDLIRKATESLMEIQPLPTTSATILNSFPDAEFQEPEEELYGPLRLVWFSQNITHGRGLELLFPALEQFDKCIEVTLIGNLMDSFRPYLIKYPFVEVEKALPQPVLHKRLQHFDIGLALEVSSVDENKMLALSNKILAYKQAGLFILATDTPAQVEFLTTFADEGVVVVQEVESISKVIKLLIANKEKIRANRHKRYLNGKDISWEKESRKLLFCWNKLMNM